MFNFNGEALPEGQDFIRAHHGLASGEDIT
jgi:hypothetical protein